jgi:peptidyl-tRNA hydrolase
LAQSCHAAIEFKFRYPEIASEWFNQSNYICILEIENETKLVELLYKARFKEIAVAEFIEPDYDNSLTAIALAPGEKSKKLCSNLRLAS